MSSWGQTNIRRSRFIPCGLGSNGTRARCYVLRLSGRKLSFPTIGTGYSPSEQKPIFAYFFAGTSGASEGLMDFATGGSGL